MDDFYYHDYSRLRKKNCKNKFSEWLYNRMISCDLSVAEVASLLRMSERTVRCHLNGDRKPSFQSVIAYCWLFDMGDIPENIWQLIEGGLNNEQ